MGEKTRLRPQNGLFFAPKRAFFGCHFHRGPLFGVLEDSVERLSQIGERFFQGNENPEKGIESGKLFASFEPRQILSRKSAERRQLFLAQMLFVPPCDKRSAQGGLDFLFAIHRNKCYQKSAKFPATERLQKEWESPAPRRRGHGAASVAYFRGNSNGRFAACCHFTVKDKMYIDEN